MTFVQRRRAEPDERAEAEWRAGAYVRLSREDGDKAESDSITNQKKIIDRHIGLLQEQGERIVPVAVYSDDGYAGGNFDRPGYRRMIRDVEAGRINCVIFKDNSRLGRNYPELGRLMEEYFPQKGVRVISVLNHLDSVRDPCAYGSALVSFSNIVNDDYIRQLSIKIRSTLDMKRQRGEFIGNHAPYGYVKSPADRHRLEIDPEAAGVVRMIFDWYAAGASVGGIVSRLDALRIPPPSAYKARRGCPGFSGGAKTGGWSRTTVSAMLRDEVYIGNLVQGRRRSVSYRSKKTAPADEREWIVVEGAHEAVISDGLFTIVHDRLARHTRVGPKRAASYPLSGLVRCAHCGGRMNRQTANGQARYRCATRARAPGSCSCPSVKEALLEAVIAETLEQQLRELADCRAVAAAVGARQPAQRRLREAQRALRQAEREKERLTDAKFRLYDSFQAGLVGMDEYAAFRRRYDDAIALQDAAVARLQDGLSDLQQARTPGDIFAAAFAQDGIIGRLDRTALAQLVDHVEVTDARHIALFLKYAAEPAPPATAEPAAVCSRAASI